MKDTRQGTDDRFRRQLEHYQLRVHFDLKGLIAEPNAAAFATWINPQQGKSDLNVDFYWIGATDSLASKYQNWSLSSGGTALQAWPGGSPGASDNFLFDDKSSVTCDWESSAVSMATVRSIKCSLMTIRRSHKTNNQYSH